MTDFSRITPRLSPQMRTPDSAIVFAETAAANAYSFLDRIGLATANVQPPGITPVFPINPQPPEPVLVTPPALQGIEINTPTQPPPLKAELNIESLLPEPFDEAPPVLMFGAAPAAFAEVAPTAPGVDTSYEMPVLDLNLPAAPNLLSLSIGAFDGVSLPTLDETVPELTAVAPSLVEYVPGSQYTSSLLTSLKDTLSDRIANGGTGLPPAAENAIWDRQREREFIASDDAIRDLERMESLGYALPPGVYLDARLRVNTEMRARQISLGREIMIKQAELELVNIQQSLTVATQLESTMLDYTNKVEQRLFDASRYATEAGIEIYNAKVRAYAAFLETYRTKVNIYEARIRGELAKVEVYRTQLAAEETKANVNNALINQFKVQTDAALSAVEVFKARVFAIQSKAELEKLKINIYGEQVRAFTARVGAYTASVEGFRAVVQAEASKQDAYKSKVQAYATNVDAVVKTIDARIEEYKGRIVAKTAEWEGYKAAYQGEASRAQAINQSNQSLVEGFRAQVAGTTGYNEVLTRQWQASLDQAQRVTEIGLGAAKANAELFVTTRSLALDAAKVGAQVSSQIAAAALNAVNYSYSNSVGYSASDSNSYQVNNSRSVSTAFQDSSGGQSTSGIISNF
jgi:hypothetical protein